jgi:hypothetical protein
LTDAKSLRPLIIVGAARSGTNVLRDALVSLPGFGTWPCDEINPLWRHGNAGHPSDELTPDHATAEVSAYLRGAFGRAQARFVGTGLDGVLVEKTCATALRVAFVRAVFPEARFIHIVRDGRDAVVSARERWTSGTSLSYIARKARFVPASDLPRYGARFVAGRIKQLVSGERRLSSWGPRFNGMDDWVRSGSVLRVCGKQWSDCVDASSQALSDLGPFDSIRIRYEDFVAEPRHELGRLAEWLTAGESAAPWRIDAPVRDVDLDAAAALIRPGSVSRWAEHLSADEVGALEHLIRPTMERTGYAWTR